MTTTTLEDVLAAVESLRGELDGLGARVAALEARHVTEDRDRESEVDPDTLAVLAAVVTSFLGKRVRIRSARQVTPGRPGAPAWARHGRAAIQTSHQLRRGR